MSAGKVKVTLVDAVDDHRGGGTRKSYSLPQVGLKKTFANIATAFAKLSGKKLPLVVHQQAGAGDEEAGTISAAAGSSFSFRVTSEAECSFFFTPETVLASVGRIVATQEATLYVKSVRDASLRRARIRVPGSSSQKNSPAGSDVESGDANDQEFEIDVESPAGRGADARGPPATAFQDIAATFVRPAPVFEFRLISSGGATGEMELVARKGSTTNSNTNKPAPSPPGKIVTTTHDIIFIKPTSGSGSGVPASTSSASKSGSAGGSSGDVLRPKNDVAAAPPVPVAKANRKDRPESPDGGVSSSSSSSGSSSSSSSGRGSSPSPPPVAAARHPMNGNKRKAEHPQEHGGSREVTEQRPKPSATAVLAAMNDSKSSSSAPSPSSAVAPAAPDVDTLGKADAKRRRVSSSSSSSSNFDNIAPRAVAVASTSRPPPPVPPRAAAADVDAASGKSAAPSSNSAESESDAKATKEMARLRNVLKGAPAPASQGQDPSVKGVIDRERDDRRRSGAGVDAEVNKHRPRSQLQRTGSVAAVAASASTASISFTGSSGSLGRSPVAGGGAAGGKQVVSLNLNFLGTEPKEQNPVLLGSSKRGEDRIVGKPSYADRDVPPLVFFEKSVRENKSSRGKTPTASSAVAANMASSGGPSPSENFARNLSGASNFGGVVRPPGGPQGSSFSATSSLPRKNTLPQDYYVGTGVWQRVKPPEFTSSSEENAKANSNMISAKQPQGQQQRPATTTTSSSTSSSLAVDPELLKRVKGIAARLDFRERKAPTAADFARISQDLQQLQIYKPKIHREVLKQSSIGKVLTELSKLPNLPTKSRNEAKELVNFLKAAVNNEQQLALVVASKNKPAGGAPAGAAPLPAAAKNSSASSAATTRTTTSAALALVSGGISNAAQQSSAVNRADNKGPTVGIPKQHREECIELLKKSGLMEKDAMDLEGAIFCYVGKFQDRRRYDFCVREARSRLRTKPRVLEMLNREELCFYHLFLLPAEFLMTAEEQDLLLEERGKTRGNGNFAEDMQGTKVRDGTACGRCGATDEIYSQTVQRGWHNDHGDPVTSYRCNKCDYRWREGD